MAGVAPAGVVGEKDDNVRFGVGGKGGCASKSGESGEIRAEDEDNDHDKD
jgi:hypothetical protein